MKQLEISKGASKNINAVRSGLDKNFSKGTGRTGIIERWKRGKMAGQWKDTLY